MLSQFIVLFLPNKILINMIDMKKLFISLALLCTVIGSSAQTNIIKTNPITFAFGNFNATYEKVLNSSSSLVFKGQYSYNLFLMDEIYQLLGIDDVKSGGVGLGYRYYFTHLKKEVPTGFYINPQASFSFGSTLDDYKSRESATSLGLGAEIGYQWVWSSGFTLDLGIGPMYSTISSNGVAASGFVPSATLSIGYAF